MQDFSSAHQESSNRTANFYRGLYLKLGGALLMLLMLATAGLYLQSALEDAVKRETARQLQTLLQADLSALKIWLRGKRQVAEQISSFDEFLLSADDLLQQFNDRPDWEQVIKNSDALRRLRQLLAPICRRNSFDSFSIVLGNKNIADGLDRTIGIVDEELLRALRNGRQQSTFIVKPYLAPASTGEEAIPMLAVVSTFESRHVSKDSELYLLFRKRADGTFSDLLNVASFGSSGESYAFDAKGRLLSKSSFEPELKTLGLISGERGSSILKIELRDPGFELGRREKPSAVASLPLTKLAQSAIATRGEGYDVDGYRNYRGIPVLGAWIWVSDGDFGIGTEVSIAEALRPLSLLRTIFGILFGLMVIMALAAFVAFSIAQRNRRHELNALKKLKQLGQYALLEKIGSGGMGSVYRAQHSLLRRPVAVKVLSEDRTSSEDLKRFEQEVQLTSTLSHPNTIAIYDFGRTDEGLFYYVMEYLNGLDLKQLVRLAGPQPDARVIHFIEQICGSLQEAHNRGLMHRDVKPANVIVCELGGVPDTIKVVDFGLIKEINPAQHNGITSPSMVSGTPDYMSPEALRGQELDARTDIYALGALIYYLLTGQELFQATNMADLITMHLFNEPERPSKRLGKPIDEKLEAIVARCLKKEREERWRSVEELAEALVSCGAYDCWTQQNARQWWNNYRPKLEGLKKTGKPEAGTLVARHTLFFDA